MLYVMASAIDPDQDIGETKMPRTNLATVLRQPPMEYPLAKAFTVDCRALPIAAGFYCFSVEASTFTGPHASYSDMLESLTADPLYPDEKVIEVTDDEFFDLQQHAAKMLNK